MGRTRRVLVIDDDELLCELIQTTFELEGFEVAIAHDVIEAERVLAGSRPDAILLDIGLPGMDGYEVARRCREQKDLEQTMLVAMTGYGKEEDRRRSHEAGFNAHLVKPVNLEDLWLLLSQPDLLALGP